MGFALTEAIEDNMTTAKVESKAKAKNILAESCRLSLDFITTVSSLSYLGSISYLKGILPVIGYTNQAVQ